MTDGLWDAVAEKLRTQLFLDGEAICHNTIMQQVLAERIVGEMSEYKYARALGLFMLELGVKGKIEETIHGKVFVFFPNPELRARRK